MAPPSTETELTRKPPPGLTSISTSPGAVLQPCGPHHRASCSGSVHAFHTTSRGASNTRVTVTSRALTASGISRSLLDLAQVVAETIEGALPEAAIAGEPVGGRLEGVALQPRRSQLRAAPPCDQAGALEHLQMLGDRLHGDGERLRQLVHGRLALREPRQDGAPRRIGQGRERGAQLVGRHGYSPVWLLNTVVEYNGRRLAGNSGCAPRRSGHPAGQASRLGELMQMGQCELCGNEYDKSMEISVAGATHVFDSFEC